MLSDNDIKRLATEELDLPIVGVFSKDLLPKGNDRQVGSYYINLQNHDEGEGTHWTLAKILEDEDGSLKGLYFDSFGFGMPVEVQEFFKGLPPIPFNNRQIQDIETTQCGYYCLYCDYYLQHLRRCEDVEDDYNNFISTWSKNPKDNLKNLKKFFKPL